jgi:signal transduction histidine kinase
MSAPKPAASRQAPRGGQGNSGTAQRFLERTARLHVRAGLFAAPLLLLLCAAMVLLLRHYGGLAALETSQRMNLPLARYVVEHLPASLLDTEGRPDAARMKALAAHVMAINPSVEVYLLDEHGRVVAHALDAGPAERVEGRVVDMAPMQRLLRAAASEAARGTTGREAGRQASEEAGNEAGVEAGEADIRLPVLGTDPRAAGRQNIFTVAPLQGPGGHMGYLYIVLNGRAAQGVAASLSNSEALRAMAAAAVLVTMVAGAVLAFVWYRLTQPLRRLTQELQGFRVEAGTAALPAAGDEIGVLRHAVQAMRERIASQFQRLEDSDRQRRELMSNISHDLRTPLSSIQGYVETVMLRGDALGPEQRASHLRTALRHAEVLGRRIADLFELSKLDSGRLQPRQEVFNLAELLQDVVQNYRLAAQRRGVRLALRAGAQAQDPTQGRVLADIAMIERVLQNLVDNALRHTAAGGSVELAIEERGAFLQVSISDTGSGIEPQHLPHIFERYWRATDVAPAAPPEGDVSSGSGLGLAIVKRILDLHGSAVRVHSELMHGTRFEFSLPQAS